MAAIFIQIECDDHQGELPCVVYALGDFYDQGNDQDVRNANEALNGILNAIRHGTDLDPNQLEGSHEF